MAKKVKKSDALVDSVKKRLIAEIVAELENTDSLHLLGYCLEQIGAFKRERGI